MTRRDKWRLAVVIFVVVVAIITVYPIKGRINLGLDLKGGSHIVLRAVGTKDAPVTNDSVERLLAILRNRIDQYGVTEPVIQREGFDKVIVDLPGIKDPEAAMELIGKTALLEFKQVIDISPEPPLPPQRKNYDSQEEFEAAKKRYEEALKEYKNYIKMLEEKAKNSNGKYTLHKSSEGDRYYLLGKTYLTGKYLKTAKTGYDSIGRPVVLLEFNSEGAKLFEKATGENVGKPLAIVLDGVVISAPIVEQKIAGGKAQISGRFTLQEAQRLAIMLRAGALPVKVEIMENRSIGPTLGADSIRQGIRAGLWGAALVVLFMLLYYRALGLIADIALGINILLLFAFLISLRATLTLPGIAGIVLTIGMAVDANILIFERIKEELRAGKTAYASVEAGFRKAFRTIFDANVTTLIAAAVLFYFGSGPIRGFAVTLSIGIITSMFCALVVTKAILHIVLSTNKKAVEALVS